jgi:hypothetical protein
VPRLGLPLAVAVAGVAAVGLLAGDPRGARSLDGADRIVLLAVALACAVGTLAWRAARRSGWWLPPSLLLALVGALAGWIAGVELTGHAEHVARWSASAREASFLAIMTAVGMGLPPTLYATLVRRR